MSQIRNHSTLRRRVILASVAALVALTLIISYAAVFSRMQSSEEASSEAMVLLPGEVKATNFSLYVYEHLDSDEIEKIVVENGNGGYSLTRSEKETSTFYVDNNESATYDSYAFSELVVAIGNTITSKRVVPSMDSGVMPQTVDYENYGLDEEQMNGRYTVTTTEGNSYTVRIGFPSSDGNGYYACLEGRNAVYILSSDLEDTVLGTVESIITPEIVYPSSTQDYYTIDYFTLWKGGKHYCSVHYLETDAEADKYAATSNYLMTFDQDIDSYEVITALTEKKLDALLGPEIYPYEYTPAIDEYAEVLKSLTDLQGDETVAIKEDGSEEISVEQLQSFGIEPSAPAYELFYSYQGINNYVLFSERSEDGYYYAYSPLFDLIVKIAQDKVSFLEWSFPLWVEDAFFQKNINYISEIEIETDSVDAIFTLVKKEAEDGTVDLTVRGNGQLLDTANFREFYKVLITRKFRGTYTEEPPAEDTQFMRIKITTDAGVETEFKFYRVSTQNMFMTLNGSGEFYVLSSVMHKLESDTLKVLAGEPIEAYERQ